MNFSIGDWVQITKTGDIGRLVNISGPTPNGQYWHQVQVGSTTYMSFGDDLLESKTPPPPASVQFFINSINPPSIAKCDCGLHAVDPKRMVGHSRGCPYETAGVKS